MNEQTKAAQEYSRSRFIWSSYGVIEMLSSLSSYKHLVFHFHFGAPDSHRADALKITNCCHSGISEDNNSEPSAVLCY